MFYLLSNFINFHSDVYSKQIYVAVVYTEHYCRVILEWHHHIHLHVLMWHYLCTLRFLGLSFKEKWNTDNTLATEVTIEDQIAQGVKLTLDTSFSPQTGYVCALQSSYSIFMEFQKGYMYLYFSLEFHSFFISNVCIGHPRRTENVAIVQRCSFCAYFA